LSDAAFDNPDGDVGEELEIMPIWLVKAIWIEDEAEASEQWEVNADNAHDAMKELKTHIRFNLHHIEASLCTEAQDKARMIELLPGQARRIPPQ
jgi:hypothetical protein